MVQETLHFGEKLAVSRGAAGAADIVAKVIADNPDVAERIRGGNPKAMGALVGPVMRETKAKADGGGSSVSSIRWSPLPGRPASGVPGSVLLEQADR